MVRRSWLTWQVSVVVPVYISEIAPERQRGALGAIHQLVQSYPRELTGSSSPLASCWHIRWAWGYPGAIWPGPALCCRVCCCSAHPCCARHPPGSWLMMIALQVHWSDSYSQRIELHSSDRHARMTHPAAHNSLKWYRMSTAGLQEELNAILNAQNSAGGVVRANIVIPLPPSDLSSTAVGAVCCGEYGDRWPSAVSSCPFSSCAASMLSFSMPAR